MKISAELKAISVILDGLIEDVEAWESVGCPSWYGLNTVKERVSATQTAIRERIKVIRSMLLQVSKDVDAKCKR